MKSPDLIDHQKESTWNPLESPCPKSSENSVLWILMVSYDFCHQNMAISCGKKACLTHPNIILLLLHRIFISYWYPHHIPLHPYCCPFSLANLGMFAPEKGQKFKRPKALSSCAVWSPVASPGSMGCFSGRLCRSCNHWKHVHERWSPVITTLKAGII